MARRKAVLLSRALLIQIVRNLARLLLSPSEDWSNPGAWEAILKLISDNQLSQRVSELEAFEDVSEEEIIFLWQSFKSSGLSEDQAWHAIVTGMALDMVFARSKRLRQVEH